MRKQKEKTALELARDLHRYNRMQPAKADAALAKEWPANIVKLVEGVMWGRVKGRTVEEIARETAALMRKAAGAHDAVQAAKRSRA